MNVRFGVENSDHIPQPSGPRASRGKDPCLDLWAKDFTSKIEV